MIFVTFESEDYEAPIIGWTVSSIIVDEGQNDDRFFGEVLADDPRWIAYFESMPPELQEGLPKPIYP